jgi:hypothetical protein
MGLAYFTAEKPKPEHARNQDTIPIRGLRRIRNGVRYHHLLDLILWLDRLSQKPLRQAVHDLDKLLADPANYFRYQEITIRPRPKGKAGSRASLANG